MHIFKMYNFNLCYKTNFFLLIAEGEDFKVTPVTSAQLLIADSHVITFITAQKI